MSKYQDSDLKAGGDELKLPGEDSVPGQVVVLKQQSCFR